MQDTLHVTKRFSQNACLLRNINTNENQHIIFKQQEKTHDNLFQPETKLFS